MGVQSTRITGVSLGWEDSELGGYQTWRWARGRVVPLGLRGTWGVEVMGPSLEMEGPGA